MTGCRIGKITLKNGGAELKIFPTREIMKIEQLFISAQSFAREGVAISAGYFINYIDGRTHFAIQDTDMTCPADIVGGARLLEKEVIAMWEPEYT